MRRSLLVVIIAATAVGPVPAETRVSVVAELFNGIRSGAELADWTFLPAGTAELSVMNRGSRRVRSELLLQFTPVGRSLTTELERLYIRAAFGDVLATIGKTRSSWGSEGVLNAGDVIFGSSSVDFPLLESDPRSETAWLTSVEVPFGAFSFVELVALPAPADASAGGRVNLAVGNATVQAGYLYRGGRIAGLGETGHHAFLSAEGYHPFNWHLSAAARSPVDEWRSDIVEESLTVTAGAFGDISLRADRTMTLQLEALVRPYRSFDAPGDPPYGLYLYPVLGFVPRTTLNLSLSSLVSPIDGSANTALSGSWNIYESLTILGSVSVRSGEAADTFSVDDVGGVSVGLGARYVY